MLKRFLVGLLAAVLLASPAAAANRKPLVIISGSTQQIPATDTLLVPAATTANASINLPHGTAPTSPNNGDCWTTTAGFYCRINGATVGPFGAGCTTFICLTDTPGNYTSAGLKVVRVNTGATALEYVTPGYFFLGTDAANLSGTVACARFPALTGDITSSAGSCATTLAASGVSAGTYTKLTVDAKGRATVGATATLASADFANQGTTTTVLHGNAAGNPSFSAVSLTADVTGTLPVGNGGTGATTLTNHAPLLGQGSSAIVATAAMTNGQVLIGSTSADPAPATITAGTGITVTNGAGSITIAATGATIPTANLAPPQGRLTLVTGTPISPNIADTAKTNIYYTAYTGPNYPIYDGTNWGLSTLSADLNLILDTTNQVANNVYDVFAYAGSNIGAGPAWVTSATITVTIASPAVVTWTAHGLPEGSPVIFTTTGALPTGITAGTTYFVGRNGTANTFSISTSIANAASATYVNTSGSQSGTHTGTNHTTKRGTGAGTTELELKNGIWTNKNAIVLYNNAVASSSISANQATYLGSFFTTANGQTGMTYRPTPASGGNNTILGLWNAYNRVVVFARSIDNSADYTYSTDTWRASNGSTSQRISWVDGLQQSQIHVTQTAVGTTSAVGNTNRIGPQLDTTNGTPNDQADMSGTGRATTIAPTLFDPQLGFHFVQASEDHTGGGTGNWINTGSGHYNRILIELAMIAANDNCAYPEARAVKASGCR